MIYKSISIFIFLLVVYLCSLYFNCFCVIGDDYWIIENVKHSIIDADHGNIIFARFLYLLNYKLPIIFGIHPQIFIQKYNIYVFGLIYYILIYLLTKIGFIFKKSKISHSIFILIFAVTFFAIALKISEGFSYIIRETCIFIRYSSSIIFFCLFWNYLISILLIKKINTLNKKNYIISFLLGILCANTSEFNSVVSIISIGLILILLFKKKIHKLIFSSISGLIIGLLAIIYNPSFIGVAWAQRGSLSFINKNIVVFWKSFSENILSIDIIFIPILIILIILIKFLYKKQLYNNIFSIFISLFAASNGFYIILYYFSKEYYEIEHGDLKILFIVSLIYITMFLFGLIIRKIKSSKIYSILISIIIAVFLFSVYKNYNMMQNNISKIRQINFHERESINKIEQDFLKQYYENKNIIKLELNKKYLGEIYDDISSMKMYRIQYIDYLKLIHEDINYDTEKIEWTVKEKE